MRSCGTAEKVWGYMLVRNMTYYSTSPGVQVAALPGVPEYFVTLIGEMEKGKHAFGWSLRENAAGFSSIECSVETCARMFCLLVGYSGSPTQYPILPRARHDDVVFTCATLSRRSY